MDLDGSSDVFNKRVHAYACSSWKQADELRGCCFKMSSNRDLGAVSLHED